MKDAMKGSVKENLMQNSSLYRRDLCEDQNRTSKNTQKMLMHLAQMEALVKMNLST